MSNSINVIKLPESLTIYDVSSQYEILKSFIINDDFTVDASQLSELDSAGFQLLVSFLKGKTKNYTVLLPSDDSIVELFKKYLLKES